MMLIEPMLYNPPKYVEDIGVINEISRLIIGQINTKYRETNKLIMLGKNIVYPSSLPKEVSSIGVDTNGTITVRGLLGEKNNSEIIMFYFTPVNNNKTLNWLMSCCATPGKNIPSYCNSCNVRNIQSFN